MVYLTPAPTPLGPPIAMGEGSWRDIAVREGSSFGGYGMKAWVSKGSPLQSGWYGGRATGSPVRPSAAPLRTILYGGHDYQRVFAKLAIVDEEG